MTRKPLLAANWKMNKTPAEAVTLAQGLVLALPARHLRGLELVLCPPHIDIRSVQAVLEYERSAVLLGAQDVYWQAEGAFTGAISAAMLADAGCRYCIVGHSERRRLFGEGDREAGLKMAALAAHGLVPILCVGEGPQERQAGDDVATDFVLKQLGAALSSWQRQAGPGTPAPGEASLVVAYEPLWSIGSGLPATPKAAQAMAEALRRMLAQRLGGGPAESVRILYGGSLSSENIAPFMAMPDIDGGLVGGASLDAEEFCRLVGNFAGAVAARSEDAGRLLGVAARRPPALLAILDGIGLAPAGPGNAVSQADAPFLHGLFSDVEWPCRPLSASGPAVGLPEGQMGNSEVGHLNIGAGRIVRQELTRIDLGIADGSLAANPVLTAAFDGCAARGGRLHLVGLLSDGGVHSQDAHFMALAEMAAGRGVKDIALHALLDGRDVAPESGIGYIRQAEAFLAGLAERHAGLSAAIASIGGRYYGMHRDRRWERVERAWRAIVCPALAAEEEGPLAPGTGAAGELVLSSYEEGLSDEFVEPRALDRRGVADGDAVVFFNFRPDRARQLTRAFIDPAFDGFERSVRPEVDFVCMTEYDPAFTALGARVALAKEVPPNVLADQLARLGLSQLHIAETEKYAHVTFFLNGGVEEPKPGERRVLIDSPKVATYDLMPEMSAYQVTEALLAALQSEAADVYVVNYANGDMVGHTGREDAAEAAVAAVDRCLQPVVEAVLAAGGVAVVTADHGNADVMRDAHGEPWTAHSLSPVPFVVLSAETRAGRRTVDLERQGPAALADVAPTLLDLMGLPIPPEFEGRSLLLRGGRMGGVVTP